MYSRQLTHLETASSLVFFPALSNRTQEPQSSDGRARSSCGKPSLAPSTLSPLTLSDGRVKPVVASSVDVVLVIVLLLLMALTQPKPLLVEGARPEV